MRGRLLAHLFSIGAVMTEDRKQGAAEPDVDDLVRRARAGEMEAFDDLVRAFQGPVFNMIYRMVGNYEDAADLAQQAFIRMVRAIGKFRGDSRFSTWLFALALNTCRSGLRRLRRISDAEKVRIDRDPDSGEESFDPVDDRDLPEKALERKETAERIEAIIFSLPEEYRIVITLRDLQGLAYDGIAESIGCSVGTVKSRLSRARQRVKTRLISEGLICAARK